MALGGCSISLPFGGGADKSADGPEITGSIGKADAIPPAATTAAAIPASGQVGTGTLASGFAATGSRSATVGMSPSDWSYARGALGLALTGPANGPPVPWANPDTGTRGNFAPSAPAVSRAGLTCRAFVARRTTSGREETLAGHACLAPAGHWDIADLQVQRAAS
jgi:surface antigen